MSHDDKETELLRAIGEARDEAKNYMEIGRSMIEQGQYVRDVADASVSLIESVSLDNLPEQEIDREAGTWRSAAQAIRSVAQDASSQYSIGHVTSILTTSASGLILYNTTPQSRLSIDPGAVTIRIQNLNDALEKGDWMERVRKELVRLRLGSPLEGVRDPQTLLEEADAAFLRPSSEAPNPAAILLPLRAAILGLVAELLRKRPKQEPASNLPRKIKSICTQCKLPAIEDAHVSRMADEADRIVNDLSASKQAQMDRQQIRASLTRGYAFLEGFLRMIDDTKLQ